MNDTNLQTSDYWVRDASFLRVKNIQIGYTFPKAWMNKAKIEKLRIYVSGENLFTISGIADMFDPEATAGNGFSNGKTYPLSKTISFGLNITL